MPAGAFRFRNGCDHRDAALRTRLALVAWVTIVCTVEEPVDKVKVARGHRYEHFERSTDTWADPDGNELRVYVWVGFTRVAE
jgi:hypothetical protein